MYIKVGYKVTEGLDLAFRIIQSLRKNGVGIAGSFTVEKISFGEGVERVFLFIQPI